MLIADFLPADGTSQLVQRAIVTPGYARPLFVEPPRLIGCSLRAGRRTGCAYDGSRVARAAPGDACCASTSRTRRRAKPVTDLEPYLGASGHLLIVNSDLTAAMHGHPEGGLTGGPTCPFGPVFPVAGRYKMWVQFQRRGAGRDRAVRHRGAVRVTVNRAARRAVRLRERCRPASVSRGSQPVGRGKVGIVARESMRRSPAGRRQPHRDAQRSVALGCRPHRRRACPPGSGCSPQGSQNLSAASNWSSSSAVDPARLTPFCAGAVSSPCGAPPSAHAVIERDLERRERRIVA